MIDDHTQGEHANHYPTNVVAILEDGSMSENLKVGKSKIVSAKFDLFWFNCFKS
jgi:hypothetical protein